MQKSLNDVPRLYFNKPQLKFIQAMSKVNVLFWGRGTGKTRGGTSMFEYNNCTMMPRSLNLLGCRSYDAVMDNILPGVINLFDSFGFVENIDYWIDQKPPSYLKIPKPYYPISNYEHTLTLFNGSVIYFGSIQFGFHNSMSFDSLCLDEARFLKSSKVANQIPAIRGTSTKFAKLWCHCSHLYLTDKPTLEDEQWIYDIVEQATPELVEDILAKQYMISEIKGMLRVESDPAVAMKMQKAIIRLSDEVNELKRKTVLLVEASTIDNIDVIGLDNLKQMRRTMSDLEYDRAVLNNDVISTEKSFYGLYDDDEHGYYAVNAEAIHDIGFDKRNPKRNWKWYTDYRKDKRLHVALDWGKYINTMAIGQDGDNNDFNIIAGLYVEYPLGLEDLVQALDDFFVGIPYKSLTIHYDHTAKDLDPTAARVDVTYLDTLIKHLKLKGWSITLNYIGKTPSYFSRYLLWQELFRRSNKNIPIVSFNLDTCKDMIISMRSAAIKRVGKLFEKDKSSEIRRRNGAHATDFSDAVDTLVFAKCGSRVNKSTDESLGFGAVN